MKPINALKHINRFRQVYLYRFALKGRHSRSKRGFFLSVQYAVNAYNKFMHLGFCRCIKISASQDFFAQRQMCSFALGLIVLP